MHRFLGGFAKGRAGLEIGNVRNVAAVFFAVENIDVVVAHKISR